VKPAATTHQANLLTQAMNDAVRFRTAAALILVSVVTAANVLRMILAPDQSALGVPRGVPIVVLTLLCYEAAMLLR